MRIDILFPCDIGAFVTIQETVMRLRTIGLISALALGLLTVQLPAEAQQAGKVYRLVVWISAYVPPLPIPGSW